jgi:hypothetical protein
MKLFCRLKFMSWLKSRVHEAAHIPRHHCYVNLTGLVWSETGI